ncbi:MAG: type III-A CRISPR-associated protein Csm2 [Cyanothece sp. SIO2G6]|nr:type III-A CRISPR-associated protein Csm2 [Cyanothece sp. SIO2G6]
MVGQPSSSSKLNRPVPRPSPTPSSSAEVNEKRPNTQIGSPQAKTQHRKNDTGDIVEEIIATIQNLKGGLQTYPIRDLVRHAQAFGPYLRNQRPSLETNQIRKFLDAVNQIKAKSLKGNSFAEIEVDIVLLKPKLAYSAARQSAIKALSKVISEAIDKVTTVEDFKRLVQLLEAIIAYHKAEGGK